MSSQVAQAFASMSYGAAPESSAPAVSWLDAHGRKFGMYINGAWVSPPGRGMAPSINPCTGEELAQSVQAEAKDVDEAVNAARQALTAWSGLSGHERAKYIYAIARNMQKHHRALAVLDSMDNGKTIRETRDLDTPLAIRHFYHHAGWAQVLESEMSDAKPVGVVGAIVPWNFPLLMLAWKVAPALATGNTVVLKPAPSTRLSAFMFCQICHEAGLPAGVVNVLSGDNEMAAYLAGHPGLDKVAFTGSTAVGKRLRQQIAGSGAKLSLELGGKSAMVVFANADLDACVEGCVDAIWMNQGQVCCAGSRLLVQESVAEQVVEKLKRRIQKIRVGDSLDKCMDMGAIIDEKQLARIEAYVEQARAEGATVHQGVLSDALMQKKNDPNAKGGTFYPPTIINGIGTSSAVYQEEIFGPVLVVISFRSPEEAVALANNTPYGLSASVWSESVGEALDVGKQMKAGVVWLNCHNLFDAAAGFGGVRESGYGREGGKEGLAEYVVRGAKISKRVAVSQTEQEAALLKWDKPGASASVPLAPDAKGHAVEGDIAVDRTAKIFVGGKQQRSDGGQSYPILAAGKVIGQVADGNRKDIRDAVEAAIAASGGWGKKPGHTRAQILYFLAENLSARADEFTARLQSITGCTTQAARGEVQTSISRLFTYAAYADKFGGTVQETTLQGVVLAVNEPIGVIAILCPKQNPLLSMVSLIAPALARGNAVLVVPSYPYAMIATDFYQVVETSDIPAGVVNIVTGREEVLGKTLAEHQGVDSIWYFGSREGMINVEHRASFSMKRSWIELEGRVWTDKQQGEGTEFLEHSVYVKNIWIPFKA